MPVIHSENATHKTNLINAERTRQAAITASSLQSAVTSADITFYRSCLSSAIANNCNPSAFTEALYALGVRS